MFFFKLLVLFSLLFTFSCNQNLTEEEKREMWSKAQTTGEIIRRSGTKFDPGGSKRMKDLAMRDAETRLQSGGGLFSKGVSTDLFNSNRDKQTTSGTFVMPVNTFLWRGALETINFMPLTSADPIGGTILTDWYSTSSNENERCKLNIFITGMELKSQNLKVTSFCQEFKSQKWVNKNIDENNNIKLEDAILNKAKKIRLQAS